MAIRTPVHFDSDYKLEFRKIPSLDNKYEVNSNGTIFRNVKTQKELAIRLSFHHSKSGYYKVGIHIGGRKPDHYNLNLPIHQAVAEAFIGPCPDKYEVDHIDRNSKNNDISNLRYVTKSEQMKNRDYTNISATGSLNLQKAREERAKPIEISNDEEILRFDSIAECSRFLANKFNIDFEKARYIVRKHNTIYDYDIKFVSK